jgi:hypothetical protein
VVVEPVLVELGGADDKTADNELVEMGIGPTEGGLDDLVQLGGDSSRC